MKLRWTKNSLLYKIILTYHFCNELKNFENFVLYFGKGFKHAVYESKQSFQASSIYELAIHVVGQGLINR